MKRAPLAGNARIKVGFSPEYKAGTPRRQKGDQRLRSFPPLLADIPPTRTAWIFLHLQIQTIELKPNSYGAGFSGLMEPNSIVETRARAGLPVKLANIHQSGAC